MRPHIDPVPVLQYQHHRLAPRVLGDQRRQRFLEGAAQRIALQCGRNLVHLTRNRKQVQVLRQIALQGGGDGPHCDDGMVMKSVGAFGFVQT
jgi:hypothetical protein